MTVLTRTFLISLFILVNLFALKAQPADAISGIPAAPVSEEIKSQRKTTTNVVQLPFFDDFSKDIHYPDPALWLDRNVYLSQTMPAQPPTLGAAVFDGLDEYGLAYQLGQLGTVLTDSLTSNYIDLSSPLDSVYLSFYWQPGGNGEEPENTDSLQVQFYNDATNEWKHAWSTTGKDSGSFELVMVPVPNGYYQDSFQFRFRSFGAPAGAYDTWLVDYVRLDQGRDRHDTLPLIKDPAFTRPHPSLLTGYESLPYFHYDNTVASALNRQQLTFHYQENPNTPPPYSPDPIPLNLAIYEISLNGSVLAEETNGNDQLDNGLDFFVEETYLCDFDPFMPGGLPRSAEFELEAFQTYTGTGVQFFTANDTVHRQQVFSNYYAYDDGTAERAYYVTDNSGGIIVSRFVIQSLADSLKGVYLYFFPAEQDVTLNEFTLVVYEEDAQGRPGNLIYESDSVYTPGWSTTNFYLPYAFDKAVAIGQTNIFVGIRQLKNTRLPIGFDRNNRGLSKVFFGVDAPGQLFESFQKGTLMIRPYLRNHPADLSSTEPAAPRKVDLGIYPNPVKSLIYFQGLDESEEFEFTLHSISGPILWSGRVTSPVSLPGHIGKGVYILTITDRKGKLSPQTTKILVQP